jgi:DNA polymerase-3 subunit delta'
MPSLSKVDRALGNFRRAHAAGRMPHAILVAGHPRGPGTVFAQGVLGLLFPGTADAQRRRHADIHWLEPEGKARQIKAEVARDLIEFIGLTSYAGGWKAGVILFADRLNETAQNILLKTLEEPPPHSLLLLVTDSPAALLPTIRSRAQFVDAMDEEDAPDTPWRSAVLDLLRHPPARQASELIAWTDRLTAPLRALAELAETEETARAEAVSPTQPDAEAELTLASKEVIAGRVATRVKEMRAELLRTIQLWQRDVLARVRAAETPPLHFPDDEAAIAAQAAGLTFAEAAARVAVVEEVRNLLEHNIRESAALVRMARTFSVPVPP